MYATRRLSDLQRKPELLAASPDGPNSGYLVIQDEESKSSDESKFIEKLPFPQDKVGHVEYNGLGFLFLDRAFFIPVLNRPLSHDCYYTILPSGKALTRSREDDRDNVRICFVPFHSYFVPMPADPKNLYQQLKIFSNSKSNTFHATTLARDDFAPLPQRKDWWISFKTPKNNLIKLDATAQGLDPRRRARLPEFKPPLFQKPVVVGKWYSPYIFVKEGTVHKQVKTSMYYEVTLEQRWEKIFAWINDKSDGARRVVMTNKSVLESEEVFVGGRKARLDEESGDGVFWFSSEGKKKKKRTRVGLRKEIVDRMKWEQERGGWVKDKVNIADEYPEGDGDWSQFGRYVLVERFNFRRMDGSLLMFFDFKHFDQMRTSFE